MRPIPARLLLAVISIAALTMGVVTSRFIFFVVALGAAVLLATSLSTSRRPLTRALGIFKNQPVEVRLWGALPPSVAGARLVLTSVNAIGVGVHLFFDVQGHRPIHLKGAQPQDPGFAPDRVTVGSARYVQWNGKRLPHGHGAPALTIALSGRTPTPTGGTACERTGPMSEVRVEREDS
jgi:hypothetical protein